METDTDFIWLVIAVGGVWIAALALGFWAIRR